MRDKKFLSVFMCIYIIANWANAQVVKYYVQLADKKGGAYSVSQPQYFLTQRALERRIRQNIGIFMDDLPVNKHYIQQIEGVGVSVLSKTRWLNGLVISTNDSSKISKIKSLPFVLSLKRIEGAFSKKENNTKFLNETAIPLEKTINLNAGNAVSGYNYGNSYNQVNMLGGVELHSKGFSGQGMVIAVLDGGFNNVDVLPAFDSLKKNNQILGTWDFVSHDSQVFDDDEHGMNVLSCMAGNLPGQLIGTAPKAGYYLLRTEDASAEYLGEEYYWISGAEYADSVGADILSSSAGYNTFDDASQNHAYSDLNGKTTPIAIAATIASRKGILVVVSAGNEGYSSWKRILSPADADSIIAVGSVDANRIRSGFSSTGPTADGRIKPTVAAQGSATVVAVTSGGTQLANGTSFSCPLTAGMVACIWQSQRLTTNIGIYNLIKKSADHHTPPDNLTGYGIPDFYKIFTDFHEQPSLRNSVFIAPNPFSDVIKISYSSKEAARLIIDLIDAKGQLVRHVEKELNLNTINEIEVPESHGLSQGIYCLKLNDLNETRIFKLIKL